MDAFVLQQIKKLFDQNYGSRKIAKQLGLTRWAVQQAYKQLGVYCSGRKTPKTAQLTGVKNCKICRQDKNISEFRQRNRPSGITYESYCLICEQKYNKIKCRQQYLKQYNQRKIYRQTHREHLRQYDRGYRLKNKIILLRKANSRRQNKINTNPIWKLRVIFLSRIASVLKNKGGKSESILQFLPYTLAELRHHLESQFEWWMTWSNHGRYLVSQWQDHDSTTWSWQIDHIIPLSTFNFTSMTDPNFLQAWSLSNLRPLSAKQNVLDGINKIRHK